MSHVDSRQDTSAQDGLYGKLARSASTRNYFITIYTPVCTIRRCIVVADNEVLISLLSSKMSVHCAVIIYEIR